MSLNVIIGFNAEALTAISELTAAIRAIGGTSAPAATTSTKTSTAAVNTKQADPADATDEESSVKWVDNTAKTCGIVADEAAFKALKKKSPKAVKATDEQYDKMVKVQAKAEADAAAAAAADDEGDEAEVPTAADVMDAFGGYLPPDLDKAERAERAKFVKPLLARFGAAKASELPEEHRALAINLVLRKAAGQDIDPETEEFEEFEAEEESLV